MPGMEYKESQKIKFIRHISTDLYRGKQINTAICTVCDQELWTEGDIDGVTGIGELNRKVGQHRHEHRMYNVPPHAPRRDER